jgi:hypothetical protein
MSDEPIYEFIRVECQRIGDGWKCQGRARVNGELMYCNFTVTHELYLDTVMFGIIAENITKESILEAYQNRA